MMMRLMALSTILLLTAAPALAQSATPAGAPAPAAASPAAATPGTATSAPALTKDGRPTMKSVREECRSEATTTGVKGDARKQAMADCIIKQRPDMADRIHCAMEPSLKGMAKEARRAAVKSCVQKTKS